MNVLAAKPFPLHHVRLLDGPFKTTMELNRRYLRSLDADRMLHTFRLNAGLPSVAEPLGGWEAPDGELRGHCLGHFLSGCALTFAATGDEQLKATGSYIVTVLAKCQAAIGSGFLSAWPESFIDRVEACERVWAPYYTLHKILAGLHDMHVQCGSQQALDVAIRMLGWLKRRTDALDESRMQKMLDATEQGGMNDVLCNLFALTGDPAHLALARRFDQRTYIEPLARKVDMLKGQHCNSYIPNVVGFAREYELTGEPQCRDISLFFWNQVVGARSYATGGTSNYECWLAEPHQIATQLSSNAHETCCTYNLLKLTRHLFCWQPDARYADYYERALVNGILSTIDPESGMTMYYVSMEPGLYKTFGTPLNSFWCCTGTGMESHATFGDSIYFHDDKGLFVNLFIASQLTWPDQQLTLRQNTCFPDDGCASFTFTLAQPRAFVLRIRVPGWATLGVSISLNGTPMHVEATPSSFLAIKRTWQNGDRIDLVMPMHLHLDRTPDNPRVAAVMCGPVVLAGQLGREGLTPDSVYGHYGPPGYPVPVPYLAIEGADIASRLTPLPDAPQMFRTSGIGRPADITLAPFHRTSERYTVYFHIGTEDECRAHAAAIDKLSERTAPARKSADAISIGDAGSERDHNLEGDHVETGVYLRRNWRQAIRGGWFSYRMRVAPDAPMALLATYWGADAGGRIFDIMVDGEKIATEELDHKSPGQFVDVEYPIPEPLTKGKDTVTVRFEAHKPRRTAGGVFGLSMVHAI